MPATGAIVALPLEHYLETGWREGLNPNPLFDVRWYLSRNPDVAAAGIDPLFHFNTSGWLSLLMMVPLVNLIFWFIPGSDGPNRYGPPTPPNGAAVIVGAIAVPVVLIGFVGILAAVAIPAYGDYTHRARISEVMMSGSVLRTAVAEHYAETSKLPSSLKEIKDAPTPPDSKWGFATLGENGVITLTMSRQMGPASDKTILIRPTLAGGGLNWDCTGGTLPPKFRPRSCRAE